MTHLFYRAGYPIGNRSLWNEVADPSCLCIETTPPVSGILYEGIDFDGQLLIWCMASKCTSGQQYWAGFVPLVLQQKFPETYSGMFPEF